MKKSAVDRHSQSCKKCWIIVCIDCNQRFEGEAYAAHVSCISEAEKHKTGERVKGGGKRNPQAEWCDTIVRASEADSRHKATLQLLVGYGNAPRKLRPFIAFARNSLKVHNEALLGEIFAYIQTFLPPRPEKKAGGGGEGEEGEEDEEGEGEGAGKKEAPVVEAAKVEKEDKKKKKGEKKEKKAEGVEEKEGEVVEEEMVVEEPKKSKKGSKEKSKKAAAEEAGEEEEEVLAEKAAEVDAGDAAGDAEEEESDGFNVKRLIKKQLKAVKGGLMKLRKLLAVAVSEGCTASAFNTKVDKLVLKGKLVKCDWRGGPGDKGKYIKAASA